MNWPTLPGETPIDDISGLKLRDVSTREQLNLAEARNILKVAVKYLATRPSKRSAKFDFSWMLRLHREMFGDVWEWAGQVRTRDLNLGVPFYLVNQELQNLLGDLLAWRQFGHDLVGQAARLHYRAVRIHPFLNGNGRWSRMLANIWLKLNRSDIIVWPEKTIGKESVVRAEYIAAIQAADRGDEGPFLELHRRFHGRQETE
ncbi:MAG TPA: mobile mystery protein B [Pirellulales bacterium]|jgi:Fic-DOC domain mobile mystery protein B|nr:mobile mystery protein B [Pirellulales bacterium]